MRDRLRVRGTSFVLTLAVWVSAPTPEALASEADTDTLAPEEEERSEIQTSHTGGPANSEGHETPQGAGLRLTVMLPLLGGGLLLAGGALMGLMADTDEQNLKGMRPGAHRWDDVEQLHASAEAKAATANALYGAGGLALGVGLVLWLVTDSPGHAAVRVGPGRVGWGGSF